MKCFTYVFTRFVLSELYTVLIIPSEHNNRLENRMLSTINNMGSGHPNDDHYINTSSSNDTQFEYDHGGELFNQDLVLNADIEQIDTS